MHLSIDSVTIPETVHHTDKLSFNTIIQTTRITDTLSVPCTLIYIRQW
jgi:hypothetical protein